MRPSFLWRLARGGLAAYTKRMKRILLAGLGARYSHSSLAPLCLKYAAPESLPIELREFNINERVQSIADAVLRDAPDALGLSCYIWNVEHALKVASTVKKVLPDCFILLGGPEVSHDAPEWMEKHPFVDMIVCGAGEAPFAHFAERFCAGLDVSDTPSAWVREKGALRRNPEAPPWDMGDTRFMYGDLAAFEHRIVYYETSRGCPFRCAYCLSADEKMSYLDLARVEKELEYFIRAGVRQVKLVDRTFNYPQERAKAILRAMISLKRRYPQSPTGFHVEISACLLDNETMDILASAPEGLLQLEVGIQSTHADTLRAVRRAHDTQAVLRNAAALCAMGHLRVHTDLIAGLPEEDYARFARSFDDVYALRPAALQLGFLKLLRGSALRRDAGKLGLVYTDYPPYEVLRTPLLSYAELSALHRVAELVDVLYNSGRFEMTLERLVPAFASPFAFFERVSEFFGERGYFDSPQPPQRAFELLAALFRDSGEAAMEVLAYDWCRRSEGGAWPRGVPEPAQAEASVLRAFLADADNIRRYLPHCEGVAARQLERRCRLYAFPLLLGAPGWVLFDAGQRGFARLIDAI